MSDLDHGRHIWGEVCRPGYGLYDRALGIMYLLGLWDAYEAGKSGGEIMIPIHENLSNRVAVITGGSGVLCSKMAVELARHGVRIAILNRTAEKGQEVVELIEQKGGTAISIAADVLDRASLENARGKIIEAFGQSGSINKWSWRQSS